MKSTNRQWEKKARRRLFLHINHERMTLKDWVVMLILTLAYAVAAFTNLGSLDIAETFYSTQYNDQIVVELTEPTEIYSIKYYTSFGNGMMTFLYSVDGEGYTQLGLEFEEDEFYQTANPDQTADNSGEQTAQPTDEPAQTVQTDYYEEYEQVAEAITLDHDAIDMYEWRFMPVPEFTAKYITIQVEEPGVQILEMAFCDSEGRPAEIVSVNNLDPDAMRGNPAEYMFDEQYLVPNHTDYMKEMYFDEVYHARTAYEHILHMQPYEITHPPLGKSIIAIGIRIFGMNPFGWRCMGALFGVLMLPLMYFLAKRMLKKTLYAFIPTFLFAVDFMHFTQTRIATIDSYSVFFILAMYLFMYIYTEKNYNTQPLHKTLLPLALCGISFGLGAATKWLCLYAGIGLAVIFFIQIGKRWQEYIYARTTIRQKSVYEAMDESKRKYLMNVSKNFKKKTILTLSWCVLFFIVVPLIIYYLAYIPYMKVIDNPYDFSGIIGNQEYMFNYHSRLLPETRHPFASDWYSWPISYRPMFFFQGQGYPEGIMSSMSSMGNPAVWWGGLVCVVVLIIIRIVENRPSRRIMFVAIAALSNYLPWVLISRETYIYHYFATVPFVILLMGILAKYIIEKFKHGKKFVIGYLAIALILFIMFYPITSGVPFYREYSDIFLRWLDSWPFY